MGRMVTFLIAFAVLAFLAMKYIRGDFNGSASTSAAVESGVDVTGTPHQTLSNVRGAARRIEANDQRRVDDVSARTTGE